MPTKIVYVAWSAIKPEFEAITDENQAYLKFNLNFFTFKCSGDEWDLLID